MSELRAACFGHDFEHDGWPSVSVVVPVRDEARHLDRAVASILQQDYPEPFDICLAIAPSSDDTEQIGAAIAAADERVSVVPNPAGVTPAGLNAAIGATQGSVVVRVDGHAALSSGYIRRAVETMRRTGAVNVGGMQVPHPETPFEQAVATATTSWLGTGGATYRVGGAEGPVDTVYLGVFDRAAGDTVGWFDPALIRNQDYELNVRLRKAGGQVWFDPELAVGYRPRGTWRGLVRQYYEYGFWKSAVARMHPESLRVRQRVAAVIMPCLVVTAAAAVRFRFARLLGVAYALAVMSPSVSAPKSALRVGGVVTCSQAAWSCGFVARSLTELLDRVRQRDQNSTTSSRLSR